LNKAVGAELNYGGRTPDEVHYGRSEQHVAGRVSYVDGRLRWYRFG
jgi:hypothetical protein